MCGRLYIFAILSLLLFSTPVFPVELIANDFKEDYIEACELISSRYVYFERKVDLSRVGFLEQKKEHADSLTWNKETFIRELRKLRATFSDGHFYWKIPREISTIDNYYTLGFVSTFTADSLLIVKDIFPHYAPPLKVGDVITEINGTPAKEVIKEYGSKEPHSTGAATQEIAARNLSLVKCTSPIIDDLKNPEITVLRNQKELTFTVVYKSCVVTSDVAQSQVDSTRILLQRNGYLSLEEIPVDYFSRHSSLLLYAYEQDDAKFCVLHPRDFVSWGIADIDTIMRRVNAIKPDALVIDLKDSAGGGFDLLLYLSHALGVKEEFRFFYDFIDEEERRTSGVDDFNFIADLITLENIWKGDVIIRTNEVCGSACDFFARWMQMHDRAQIVGMPPAGRGGGTDGFKLKHTKAIIGIPKRERIPIKYPRSIEGETMEIDYYSELDLKALLEEYCKR